MTTIPQDKFSVEGMVVAVTGAAGVIFGTVSKMLAARGAKIALLDIQEEKVKELEAEINSQGGQSIGLKCNVMEPGSIQDALNSIIGKFGRCDALINGAGGNRKGACVPPDGRFTELSLDELDKVFALNYKGTFMPTQAFCRYFAEQGKGVIINTSSMSAIAPLTNVPGYSNAKAAVTNLTKWLSVQVKVDFPDASISVNEIAPGFLDTTQNHHLLFQKNNKTLTARGESIISHTPMNRFGNPEELLGPITLFLSDAGSFIHGVTLCVDGGFDAYSGVGPLDEKA